MNNKEHLKEIPDNQIFIVEDNNMHSLMLDYLLSKQTTAHIRKFNSGEECIANLKFHPDVVILDYGLPGMDGMKTFLEIKKVNPDVAVIVVTGNKDRRIALQFLNAGVYDFIRKEDDAFGLVGKITDNILNILAVKEAKVKQRRKIKIIRLLLIISTIVSIISFACIKHWFKV